MNWKHPLFRAFIIWLMGMIALILLFSQDYYPLKSDRPPFKSNAQSTLYFRNLRSYFYFHYEDPASKFRIHRWKRWEDQWRAPAPFVHWMLVENWRNEEVYILLKPNEKAIDEAYSLFVVGYGDGSADTLHLEEANSLEHEALARKIYAALGNGERLLFEVRSSANSSKSYPLLESEKERKNLQTLLEDYFKWTNIR